MVQGLLHGTAEDRTIAAMAPTDAEELDPKALTELAELARQLREIKDLQAKANERFKKRIVEMREQGYDPQAMAEVTQLTHQRVYQILNRAGNSSRPRGAKAAATTAKEAPGGTTRKRQGQGNQRRR